MPETIYIHVSGGVVTHVHGPAGEDVDHEVVDHDDQQAGDPVSCPVCDSDPQGDASE